MSVASERRLVKWNEISALFCLTCAASENTISREASTMSGILYLVSTPIGEPRDITTRAKRVLSEANVVICEERRIASTLLAHIKIDKPLIELNEHTEATQVSALLARLLQGERLALVSDHGTPLVADPGGSLVAEAVQAGVPLVPVPGASAVISALVVSGLPAKRFRFIGQLPAKTEKRVLALRGLKNIRETLLIIDAAYRLLALLKSMCDELGKERQIAVACNITLHDERIVRGSIGRVLEMFERSPFKGEFVCVVQGAGPSTSRKRN